MTQVHVTIDSHSYRMACEPGEEERVSALAAELDGTIAALKARLGEIGDRRITVMAALQILDRLREAEAENAALRGRLAQLERAREEAALAADGDDAPLVARIDAATAAVERLTQTLTAQVHAMAEDHGEAVPATFGRAPAVATDPLPPPDRETGEVPQDTLEGDMIPAFMQRP